MKLIIFSLIITLVSCNISVDKVNFIYKLTYKVYWTPTENTTYIVSGKSPFYYGSSHGTNFICEKGIIGNIIIQTSAPIEILEYQKIKSN